MDEEEKPLKWIDHTKGRISHQGFIFPDIWWGCPYCGEDFKRQSKFCPDCGKLIAHNDAWDDNKEEDNKEDND